MAVEIDDHLRRLSRQECLCRRALGQLARHFLERHGHNELGFARLSDYTRERLGMSSRELQQMAAVAQSLEKLPQTSAAFEEGRLTWTRLRLLVSVASTESESWWLAQAMHRSSLMLESAVQHELEARRRKAAGAEVSHEVNPSADDQEPDRAAEDRQPQLIDNQIDGEPRYRFHLPCPYHVRLLWRRTLEYASRMAGSRLAVWQAAEVIAAEGLSGGRGLRDVDLLEPRLRDRPVHPVSPHIFSRRLRSRRGLYPLEPRPELDCSALRDVIPEAVERLVLGMENLSAWQLDSRLRRVVAAMQCIDWQTGRLLWGFFEARLNAEIGYRNTVDYILERTSLGLRKARALLAIERKAREVGPALTEAYRDGRLSWARALTLLPVLAAEHAAAWVERASEVTARRLAEEVEWALVEQDRQARERPVAPPPRGARLDPWRWNPDDVGADASPDQSIYENDAAAPRETATVQSGSHTPDCTVEDKAARLRLVQSGSHAPDYTVADQAARLRLVQSGSQHGQQADRAAATDLVAPYAKIPPIGTAIIFEGPASIVDLFENAMLAHREVGEPLWRSLERMLRHVIEEWENQPRHRDPIFERDGWRCTVPGCSSRRNLQDHHLVFRSRGGDNGRSNRVSVCAWHHLRGIHRGRVRAQGRAPEAVVWEIGLHLDGKPLMRLIGDTYLDA